MTGILRSDTMRSKSFPRTRSTAPTLLVVVTTSIPSISRMAFMASHTLASSSTTSALILSMDRHPHRKCRPLPRNARDLDVATVFLDDAVAHGQAEAGALGGAFGRKKGVENLAHMLRRYARTGVAENDLDGLVRGPGRDLDLPRRGDGMDGV